MAKFKMLSSLNILNLTKFLINFLYLAKFLRLWNLAQFLIFLLPPPLLARLSLSTTASRFVLFDNSIIELILSL